MTDHLKDPPGEGALGRAQQALEQAADELVLRRAAQGRAERWLDGVLRNVGQPLLVVDGSATVRAASRGATEVLGGGSRRMVGRPLASALEEHLEEEALSEVLHHVRTKTSARVVSQSGDLVLTTPLADEVSEPGSRDLLVLVDP